MSSSIEEYLLTKPDKWIKGRRLEAGLTQEKFAEKANLTRNYISLLESGKREPSLETLRKIFYLKGDKI